MEWKNENKWMWIKEMKAMWEKNGGKEKNQTKMWEKEGWKKRRKKSAGNEKKNH